MRAKLKWWFWSRQKENENSAQTVFRMLGNIFRWAVSAVMFLIVILLISGAIFYLSERGEVKARKAVTVINIGPSDTCGKDFPISISIGNASDRTVESLRVELEAKRRNRSTNILSYSEANVEWDVIMPPSEGHRFCYKFPEAAEKYDLTDLVWSATVPSYSIRFADD